jgi:hypothetical protein
MPQLHVRNLAMSLDGYVAGPPIEQPRAESCHWPCLRWQCNLGDLDEVPALPPAGTHADRPAQLGRSEGRHHGGGPQRDRVDRGDLEPNHWMRQDVARVR